MLDPFVALFAESAGRVLVTVARPTSDAVLARAAAAGVPAERLGTTGGDALDIADVGDAGAHRAARGLGGHRFDAGRCSAARRRHGGVVRPRRA